MARIILEDTRTRLSQFYVVKSEFTFHFPNLDTHRITFVLNTERLPQIQSVMKVKIVMICLAVLVIGISAFDSTIEEKECGRKSVKSPSIIFPTIKIPQLVKEPNYMVGGRYRRPISKKILNGAKSLTDIISDYPSSWISNYTSVEINAEVNDKQRKATGKNAILNKEQKDLLSLVEISSDVIIDVKYRAENSATRVKEERLFHVGMTVIPEKEAEFKGGHEKMIAFLKENSGTKIKEIKFDPSEPVRIGFTVSETGEIEDAEVIYSSGNKASDTLLMKLLYKMPKWAPAENLNGKSIKQEFDFVYGMDGC